MNLPLEHIHCLHLGTEDRRPVNVALLRVKLYEREFRGNERASSPPGAILWWDTDHDDLTIRCAALPSTAPTDLRAWNEADFDAPAGWTPSQPDVGQVGHEIRWFTGHASTVATVADAYLGDLSVLLVVVTAAAHQLQNEAKLGPPVGTWPDGCGPCSTFTKDMLPRPAP